jgi:hypothetical protein
MEKDTNILENFLLAVLEILIVNTSKNITMFKNAFFLFDEPMLTHIIL